MDPLKCSMDPTVSMAGDWEMIEAQLPSEWRQLAEEHGVIKPVPPQLGAKLNDPALVLRLILHHVALGVSLKVTCAMAAAANLVRLSAVSLHLRMRSSGAWLAAMLSKMTAAGASFHASLWAGFEIVIADATVVTRPGAKGTTARVHYVLRLSDLALIQCEVTDEHGGETVRRFRVIPGQLWLLDRGYANPPGIAALHLAEAAVLVRYNFGSLPLYDVQGKRIDVRSKVLRLRKVGRAREWTAYVHPDKEDPIAGRLCAVRLPKDKASEARARLRKEQGKDVTEEALEMADFVIVFTTVPKTSLTLERIFELYRLRWQVELKIKRDKSIAGLDTLPNFRPDTIHAWICAKLLAQQIAHRLTTPQVAFPPSAVGRCALPLPAQAA
jgi:hypothetical protein